MKIINGSYLLRLLCASLVTMLCQSVQATPPTLESTLRSDPEFSLFTKALDLTHLWEQLENEATSLFVPTDRAMATEGSDFLLKSVLITEDNEDRLKQLVSLHISTAPIELNDDNSTAIIQTIGDECLRITRVGSATKVGSEAFVVSSLKIGKNQLFVIDRLLIPPHEPDSSQCATL